MALGPPSSIQSQESSGNRKEALGRRDVPTHQADLFAILAQSAMQLPLSNRDLLTLHGFPLERNGAMAPEWVARMGGGLNPSHKAHAVTVSSEQLSSGVSQLGRAMMPG